MYDTVPHNSLLYKLDWHGIRNQTLQWINLFSLTAIRMLLLRIFVLPKYLLYLQYINQLESIQH